MAYYKVPPNDPQAEQAVLGAMLLDRQAIPEIIDIVKPNDFYQQSHKEIFEAIIELYNQGEPVDLITLSDKLKGQKTLQAVGGITYLTQLMDVLPSIESVKTYCEIIRDKSQRRKIIYNSHKIIQYAYGDKETEEIVDHAEKAFKEIILSLSPDEIVKASDLTDATLNKFEFYYKNKGHINGIVTGYADLDNKLLGLQKSDLIVIAARPSMGKTAFALGIAENASLHKHKTIFFSLEMSKEQIMQRLICNIGLVNHTKAKRGELTDDDWESIAKAAEAISKCELYIDDTSPLKVSQIKAKCRAIEGLELIVIDYLDFLLPESKSYENRTQVVSQLTKDLKTMAKQLNIPVILLVQLSRKCEERQNKRPVLSDLRDSGAIEQDADIVMFIYRDDYYYPDSSKKRIAEIIIAKQRNGETGTIELGWMPEYTKFVDLLKNP